MHTDQNDDVSLEHLRQLRDWDETACQERLAELGELNANTSAAYSVAAFLHLLLSSFFDCAMTVVGP